MIDFTKARIKDVKWWRRVNILIDDMARDDDLKIVDAAYRFHLALVANPHLTDDSWKQAKTSALSLFNDAVNVLHPWGARSVEQRQQEEMANLRRLYKEEIGDLDDPAFMQVIDAEVQRMRTSVETPPETAEQRIDRLFCERILRGRQ